MPDHTVTIKEKLWNDIATLIGVDPYTHTRTIQEHIRDTMRDDTIAKLVAHRNGWSTEKKTEPKAEPKVEQSPAPRIIPTSFFGDGDVPHFTDTTADKFAPWPLRSEVAAFARYINLDPEYLKPDHSRDQDEEYKHVEEKKFWIRCGFQFKGMDDPRTTAEHVAGDINDDRAASDLPDRARAAHIAMRSKFRTWWKQTHK